MEAGSEKLFFRIFMLFSLFVTLFQVKAARPAAAPFHDNRQQLIEFEVRLLGSSSMTEDGFLYPDDE